MSELLSPPADDCVSDLRLDRMISGELAADEERNLRSHVEGCERCAARLAELEEDGAAFARDFADPSFLAHPPALAPTSDDPDGNSNDNVVSLAAYRNRTVGGAIAAVTAAAAAVVFFVSTGAPDPRHDEWTGIKGGGFLTPLVARPDGARSLTDGDEVHPGDRLRFQMKLPADAWVTVLGRDTSGQVWSYATEAEGLVRLEAGDHALPGAIQLDDVGDREELFGFACSADVGLAALKAAVPQAGEVNPPAGCRVHRVGLRKR